MTATETLGLVIIGLTMGAHIVRRSLLVRYLEPIVVGSGVLVFSILGYWSYLQYRFWQASAMGKFLLPPYRDLNYFIDYVGERFFTPYLIALVAAIAIPAAAYYLNKRLGERFFEAEEPKLFSLGIFLTGYPGFLLYIPLILLTAVLVSAFYSLRRKGRTPLCYFWLPAAAFAIIIKHWLIPPTLVSQFVF